MIMSDCLNQQSTLISTNGSGSKLDHYNNEEAHRCASLTTRSSGALEAIQDLTRELDSSKSTFRYEIAGKEYRSP